MTEIQRYEFELFHCNGGDMSASPDGDWVLYDDHAEIVAAKDARISELELMLQKNAVKDGNEIYTLLQQVQVLAAENVELKNFSEKLGEMHNDLNGEGTGIQGRSEVACQQVAIEAVIEEFDAIETPATDAVIREIRAQAVEVFVSTLADQLKTAGGGDGYHSNPYPEFAEHIELKGCDYVEELRAGEQP